MGSDNNLLHRRLVAELILQKREQRRQHPVGVLSAWPVALTNVN